MNTLKLVPVVAFLIAFSLTSKAGTPKGEANATKSETKPETPTESKAKSGTTYYWFTESAGVLTYQATNDEATEVSRTGCDGAQENPLCEKGFLQSQLANQSNPSQGVQSGQIGNPSTQIFHSDN